MGESRARSGNLLGAANLQKQEVNDNLRIPLNGLKLRVDNLRKLRERIQNQLTAVKGELNALPKDTGMAATWCQKK